MAVTYDSAFNSGAAGTTSPKSFVSNAGRTAGTVNANSNRVLIGYVGFNDVKATIGTVTLTWDQGGTNQAMTEITSQDLTGGSGCAFLFGLINPASGNLTLQVTWSGGVARDVVYGAISVYNADQTTGWNNSGTDTGTSTSPSSDVTTTSGDLVIVGHVNRNATSTTISAGSLGWVDTGFDNNHSEGYKASASTTETVAWTLGTSVNWRNVKVNVIQVAGLTTEYVSPVAEQHLGSVMIGRRYV